MSKGGTTARGITGTEAGSATPASLEQEKIISKAKRSSFFIG